MNYRWFGAVLIIGSCTGCGISLSIQQARELTLLNTLLLIIQRMANDLNYKAVPLPELLTRSTAKSPPTLKRVFSRMSAHLERQILPDASCCMEAAVEETELPYMHLSKILLMLGQSLGRFDLDGQLRDLAAVASACTEEIQLLRSNHSDKLRICRVLGICAGVAMVILLI